MFIKKFTVTRYEQSLTNIKLIILPQYSTIDPLEQWMPIEWRHRSNNLVRNATFKWWTVAFCVYGWNIELTRYCLSGVPLLNVWAVALIIVCEVCISFVIGFFMSFSKKHADGLQNTMFDATPYDESQEVQQSRPSMPQITYQEILPHGSYTFCSILQSIVIDHLKVCVYVYLYVHGFCLMILLGAPGLWFIIPIIDKRTRRRISEQYLANGTIVEGKVVHRFALGLKARVQYAVTDTSTFKILRYEKTIPGSYRIAGRLVQIPDNPRLYILHPDLPCSARFADEIELHDKLYEFQANKWVRMTFYIMYHALQQSVCGYGIVSVLFFEFPTAWSLSINSTCAIVLGVQLFILWRFASLRSRRMLKDMVHDEMHFFDVALQQSICVWLLLNQLSWAWWLTINSTFAINSTVMIMQGVQIFIQIAGFAFLCSRCMVKDTVHNATQLFDVESDISLKSGAVDNTLALGDSTTTSEDRFDFESPSPYRRFFQGDVLYEKIRLLD